MIAIDDNFKISENGGTGNATIFVSATDKNLFSTASTQVEVSTSVGGNIKRYVTLNKKAAHGYMYTPVEWVSNEDIDTRIWIDLGYVWKNNSRAQLGFVIPGSHQKPNGQQVFGEDTVWSSDGNAPLYEDNDLRLFFTKSGSNIGAYWDVASARISATVGAITDVWQNWEIGNNYIKNLSSNTNIVTGSTYSISRTGTVGLYGACQYLNTGRTDCVRYSYIKIYEGDTLVRDIIPVLDKDNIPCFFDKVTSQFYYYKVNGEPSTGLTAGNVAYYTSDYIEGDGSDYIDIGYVPNSSTSIEIDFEGDSSDLFGATNRGASNGMFGYFDSDRWNWRYDYRYGNFPKSTFSGRTLYKMTPSGDYVNNVQRSSWSGSWSNISATFYIFGIHRESTGLSGGMFNGKIYGVKIYEGNTLVREYIPYKQYGVVGLYEKINGIFYPSNSNTITQGGSVQPVVEKVIYSESDITISNETPSTAITYGNTFSLEASTTPTGATLSYSSSDTSIATVDNSGVVTAVGKGNATITITAQGFNDDVNKVHYNTTSKTVSVECAYQSQQILITNSTPSEAINPNDTFDLNASTTPTGITLTYSSSDTSVATVNSNGVITGVATGTTTITISAQGFDDDVNKVHYNTTSKTVTVEVQEVSFNPLRDSGYFVVKALSNTKVAFVGNNTSPDLYYRINGASSWQYLDIGHRDPEYDDVYNNDEFHIALNEGDYAEIKGNITNDYTYNPTTTSNDILLVFHCNTPNSIEIGGYLTALNQNEEINQINNELTVTYQYKNLFSGCTGLVSAQYLKLSNNTTEHCYERLFYKCSNLVTPPQQIQVSNLAEQAFLYSFYACTSLASVPVLPATHIGPSSYGGMFRKCTSLTTVSLLSPRTFDYQACRQMFMDCTNLTSLSVGFSEYDSSTLALNEILKNVTTTGTFYCPSNATYSESDIGLPSTWTLSKTL